MDYVKRLVITGQRQAGFEEVGMPSCGTDEVLIRASTTAVSTGTEIRVYRGIPIDEAGQFIFPDIPLEFPMENGYSMVGEVVEVGKEVANFVVGDRVFATATHREYAVVPANLVTKLPVNISNEHAVFSNIVGVGHIAIRRGNPAPGENVAIIGQGVIGLSVLAYCQAFGFRTIAIDYDAGRLSIAKQMGADLAISPDEDHFLQQVLDFCDGDGPDLVLEAATSWPAIQMGMDIACTGGTVVVVSRHTDLPHFNLVGGAYLGKQLTFLTSYGYPPDGHRWDRDRSMALTLDLMQKGRLTLEPMITHRFTWQALPDIYRRLDQGERELVGIVVDWT